VVSVTDPYGRILGFIDRSEGIPPETELADGSIAVSSKILETNVDCNVQCAWTNVVEEILTFSTFKGCKKRVAC
jgi:hypothetical protein